MTKISKKFWQSMRTEGFIVLDAPTRKVAVFANQSGEVVLATQEDKRQCITTLTPVEVSGLVTALVRARIVAKPIEAAIKADYAIWLASASGGARVAIA